MDKWTFVNVTVAPSSVTISNYEVAICFKLIMSWLVWLAVVADHLSGRPSSSFNAVTLLVGSYTCKTAINS